MIRAAALLNLRHLRRQPLRTGLAVVAIAAGVSLLTAVLIVSESLTGSVAHFYAGLSKLAALRVEGADSQGGITEATLAKVRATPGVAAAAPVVVAVTTIDRPGAAPVLVAGIGIDCSVQALIGNFGCSSSAVSGAGISSPPYISPSLAHQVGPTAVVHTDLSLIPLRTAPTLGSLEGFNQGRALVFALPEAQAIFARPGQFDDILIKAAPGVATSALQRRLQAAIGPQNPVVSASAPPAEVAGAAAGAVALLAPIALVALVMGAILVASILRLSLAERRRELAVASALGASRAKVVGGILAEALVIGLAGGVAGAALGAIVAHPLVGTISTLTAHQLGVALTTIVKPAALLAAVVVAVATGVLAALGPARRATSFDLAAELSERREPLAVRRSLYGRAAAATGLGVLGLVLTWVSQLGGALRTWQPNLGVLGILLTGAGLLIAAGTWTPIVLRAISRIVSDRSGAAVVAVRGLASEPGRTTGMAVAVALAVGLGTGLSGMVPTLRLALSSTFGAIDAGRVHVSSVAVNNGSETESKLSPPQLARLARIPGVASVAGDYYLTLPGRTNVELSSYPLLTDVVPFKIYSGGPSQEVLASGEVMVGAGLARVEQLRPGSYIELPSPSGMIHLRVGGVWEDAGETGFDIVVSKPVLYQYWGTVPATGVYLTAAPGVSVAELVDRVQAAHLGPDVRVLAPGAYINEFTTEVGEYVSPLWVIQRALMVLALLATLSTLLLIGVQRRRELGILGALGLGPDGLARMTLAEAGAAGLVAAILGVGVGLGIAVAVRECAGYLFGLEPALVFSGMLVPALGYSLVCLVAVVIGAGVPAWRTSQLQITDALRYE
jgi:putative ABC transport system permease protein